MLINQAGVYPPPEQIDAMYREIFPNNTGQDQHLQETGWAIYMGNGQDKVRLALEISSDNWFVSDVTVQNNTGRVWEQKSIVLDETAWRQLDFIPGSSLAVGSSASLDAGLITGFGLYVDNLYSGRNRFDSFEIITTILVAGDANRDGTVDATDAATVSEPDGLVLLVLGLMACLAGKFCVSRPQIA